MTPTCTLASGIQAHHSHGPLLKDEKMLENDENKLTNVVRSSHLAHVQHHQGIQKGHRLYTQMATLWATIETTIAQDHLLKVIVKSNKMAAAFSM